MANLDSLIRIKRFELDTRRRELADLDALSDRLAAEARALEEEIAAEQAQAAGDPMAALTYGGYAQAAIARRENLARSRAEARSRRETARAALQELFAEIKRYETVRDRRRARQREAERKADLAAMDAIALEQYRRGETG